MTSISTSHALKQSILQCVESGSFPDSEEIASAPVTAELLPELLHGIGKARDKVRSDIREISRDVAPDVDGWIRQATQLQADIDESKTTAHQIVKQAEEARKLRETQADLSRKAELLRVEVDFHSKLESVLQDVRELAANLNNAQRAAKEGNVGQGLKQIQQIQSALNTLEPLNATAPVDILQQRTSRLQASLIEQLQTQWANAIHVDEQSCTLEIQERTAGPSSPLDLAALVRLSQTFDLFEHNMQRFSHAFDTAILSPLLQAGPTDHGSRLEIRKRTMAVSIIQTQKTAVETMADLEVAVRTLHEWAPFATAPTSASLTSSLCSRLQSQWLGPAVPVELDQLEEYGHLLAVVSSFVASLSSCGWKGTEDLSEWASSAPKVWLAKRREASLGRIRTMLSEGMHKRKTVERVETQVVQQDEVLATDDAGGEWDEPWGEEDDESSKSPTKTAKKTEQEDNETDASAWGWDEDGDTSPAVEKKAAPGDAGQEEDDDAAAWGWDDQQAQSEVSSPVESRKKGAKGNKTAVKAAQPKKEVTLRESYAATAVPDELLEMIVQIVKDAERLRHADYANSAVVSAALGLLSIPTLALAGYRALAPTFYQKIAGGNMFRYNDSVRLAEELRKLAQSQAEVDQASGQARTAWPSTRMKLEAEISALEAYSRRAYGQEMDSQRQILRDLLDSAQGFANCAEEPFASECENAVLMTADRIRAVAKEWSGILSQSALLQSLGSLFSAVIGKMIVDIQEMSDIGEAESKQLRKHCQDMSKVNALFIQEQGPGQTTDMTPVYTPNWFKLQYLSEMMESSMADIKWLWNESDLKLEFEADEVVDLIEALFAESDLRRRTIAEIRRS